MPDSAAGRCSYGCGYRARFTVGSETVFYDACARHLAHFTTRLIEETPDDHWFKIAEYADGATEPGSAALGKS